MRLQTVFYSLMMAIAIIGLAACSGGGGGVGATAGSGNSVAGTIAGFGSVIMDNGVEYDTNSIATCEVDNLSVSGVCEDSLSVGMTVNMQVDANGAVSSIRYNNDLKGPATNVTGSAGVFSFTVFGAAIDTANPGTQWRNFTTNPPLLAELTGANVEISGTWQANSLTALYVEKQTDSANDAEGTVGTVNGTMFSLTLESGTVINVDAASANFMPQAGDYVGVEGTYDGVNFVATKISIEDGDDFDSDGEAEITGMLVLDANSSTGHSINNTDVDISGAPSCTNLVGSTVEAKGSYSQSLSVLTVNTCNNEQDDLAMMCLAGTVTTDSLLPKVGSVTCTFPGATGDLLVEFRDSPQIALFSDDSRLNPFSLGDIRSGDCVEIEASTDATTGATVAGSVQMEGVGISCEKYKLKGPVSAFTDNVSITILGVTYTVDATTSYPNGLPVVGTSMKITDVDGNGIADSVKIDD